jgi:hypothetical protein
MNEEDRQTLENALPPGWKIITKLTQTPGTHYHDVTLQAVSDAHNVVLEGTFSWIKRKATAYSLSGGL